MNEDRISQVKQNNDIVDVVGGYLSLRPAGPTFKGLCPFHDDKHPSFDVDPRRQRYRCWSCGKVGDVISFVMEMDRVGFREALETLARRAGISLQEDPRAEARANERSLLLKVTQWAHERFQSALDESQAGQIAREYLENRGLEDETIRLFGVGVCPPGGSWLADQARRQNISTDALEKLGIVGKSWDGTFYDRFKGRVLFPIRNVRGQTVGFGGRVLPGTPEEQKGPKYYNSIESPVFSKSDELFGLDLARNDASRSGQLVVMEGYTDVMMAHQHGIRQAVATMGTALTNRHVRTLRRFAPRVVLLYDADAGGKGGVQKALEIFAGSDVDLRVATLPEGLDPCDVLANQGPDSLLRSLAGAEDALDHALRVEFANEAVMPLLEKQQAVEKILGILARVPVLADANGAMKTDLILNRIQRRLGISETSLKNRLNLLRQNAQLGDDSRQSRETSGDDSNSPNSTSWKTRQPGRPEERELIQVLLAEPRLLPRIEQNLRPEEVAHPELRRILEAAMEIHHQGKAPTPDLVNQALDDASLVGLVLSLQEIGEATPAEQRETWLAGILDRFIEKRVRPTQQKLKAELLSTADHEKALELLRRLKVGPETAPLDSQGN